MKCGVSVSKMVAVEEQAKSGSNKKKNRSTKTTKWVEEAEFQGCCSVEFSIFIVY